MPDNYKFTSYVAFVEAKYFEEAAIILEQQDKSLLSPTVVNAAFACELYLKTILFNENKSSRKINEHDLGKLLNFLPLEIYTEIYNECNDGIFQFDKFLKDAAIAFCEWRYIHDIKKQFISISCLDLLRFAKILRHYIEIKYNMVSEELSM